MTQITSKKRHIAVEGPIGVGKTTLAKRLSEEYQLELLLEGAEDNPFLTRFYQNPQSAALPTQLFFLFQRIKQLEDIKQSDMFVSGHVADFLMEKDRLFAQVTLDNDELNLYHKVFDNLTLDSPKPDLVIYLQAPVPVLLERIRKRGRKIESNIQYDYLEKICNAYTEFFYYYNDAPLLIINASEIDVVSNDHDYQQLLKQISQAKNGRHYFNPHPNLH